MKKKKGQNQLALDFDKPAAKKPAAKKPTAKKPAAKKPAAKKPAAKKPRKCVKHGYRPRTGGLKDGEPRRVYACEDPDQVYELTKRKRRAGDPE